MVVALSFLPATPGRFTVPLGDQSTGHHLDQQLVDSENPQNGADFFTTPNLSRCGTITNVRNLKTI
jgi:hypothetical protein